MKINEDQFGAVPFWFWNGDQNEQEISRQMELAKTGGWRGMTIHARSGNKTPYMSQRWLDLIRHACGEARRLGLEIWIYDEEGFPSGSVGWRLPKKDDRYRQKLVRFTIMSGKDALAVPDVIRYFDVEDIAVPLPPEKITDTMQVLVMYRVLNEYPVTDYLSAEAGQEFLNMTHRIYEKELKEFFGDPITVIYTDDIAYLFHPGHVLPWNDKLEETFVSMHGYSLCDNLSAIVENLPSSPKVRRDYRETLSVMLNTNFVRPMHEWAQKNGLIFSGHLCCDEGPFALLSRITGDPSAFYMEEDIPGLDDFCTFNTSLRFMSEPRNTNINGGGMNQCKGFPVTTVCKQVSSISSQFKNGKCSAEVLTFAGWGLPVRSQMAQMFFEFALGINIIVHHDCSYDTAGGTKRDCPASYFFQQPYFAVNNALYRPVKRTLALLNRGRIHADTLVLFPNCAAWETGDGEHSAECGPGTHPATAYVCRHPMPENERTSYYYTDLMQDLNLELLRRHVSFEYGYERIIRQYGKAENGAINLGDCCYHTVIIPGIDRIPAPVKDVLDAFRSQGGRVIYIDQVSDLPDDLRDDIPLELPAEVALCTRLTEDGKEYYLINYACTPQVIGVKAPLELFDPLRNALVDHDGSFRLPPLASCHLLPAGTLEDVERIPLAGSDFALADSRKHLVIPGKNWTVTRTMPNIYLIDTAKDAAGEEYIFDYAPKTIHKKGTVLTHTVTVPAPCKAQLYFEPENAECVSVNGKTGAIRQGHPATQSLAIMETELAAGENTITFTLRGDVRPEYLYLAGDFAVQLENDRSRIVPEQPLTEGDLTKQGLPFYWGAVTYETDFEYDGETCFTLSDADGVVTVELNGEMLGLRYTAPWTFDFAGHCHPGKNHLKVTLYNTAQNFFGMHRKSTLQTTRWRPAQTDTLPGANDYSTASFGVRFCD